MWSAVNKRENKPLMLNKTKNKMYLTVGIQLKFCGQKMAQPVKVLLKNKWGQQGRGQ